MLRRPWFSFLNHSIARSISRCQRAIEPGSALPCLYLCQMAPVCRTDVGRKSNQAWRGLSCRSDDILRPFSKRRREHGLACCWMQKLDPAPFYQIYQQAAYRFSREVYHGYHPSFGSYPSMLYTSRVSQKSEFARSNRVQIWILRPYRWVHPVQVQAWLSWILGHRLWLNQLSKLWVRPVSLSTCGHGWCPQIVCE